MHLAFSIVCIVVFLFFAISTALDDDPRYPYATLFAFLFFVFMEVWAWLHLFNVW